MITLIFLNLIELSYLDKTKPKLIIFSRNPYVFPFLRLHNIQITTTKTINSTIGTTIAIAIIVPLESPSLLDTFPAGLESAKVVGVMVSLVSLVFNTEFVGAVVAARVEVVAFASRKNNLP